MNDSNGSKRGHSVPAQLTELKQRLLEISDLGAAGSVLGWDQATYMPPGGTDARGRQSAILRRLAHERSVDPALGKLIDSLEPYAATLPADETSALRNACVSYSGTADLMLASAHSIQINTGSRVDVAIVAISGEQGGWASTAASRRRARG